MPGYMPIAVSVAKDVMEAHDKDLIIILAWDEKSDLIHTTTYGRKAAYKEWAAEGGIIACQALGGATSLRQVFEDYHLNYDAARYKEAVELLRVMKAMVPPSSELFSRVQRFLEGVNGAHSGTGSGGDVVRPSGDSV